MDKRTEESSVCAPHLIDKLNVNDFQVKSVLGTGETILVAGEEKSSSGQIWFCARYCSEYQGGEKLSGETQRCHRVGFHRVCYRGV